MENSALYLTPHVFVHLSSINHHRRSIKLFSDRLLEINSPSLFTDFYRFSVAFFFHETIESLHEKTHLILSQPLPVFKK